MRRKIAAVGPVVIVLAAVVLLPLFYFQGSPRRYTELLIHFAT